MMPRLIFLCVLCVSAVNPPRALARDDALLPPLTQSELVAAITTARASEADGALAEAQRLESEWQRVRYGKVVGKKRGQSHGVNVRLNPAEFESREVKIEYLAKLKRDAAAARDRAAWLGDPACDWLPTLDLWLHTTLDASPQVGQIGEVASPNSRMDYPDFAWPTTRLPLRILSTRPDGSAIVVSEIRSEQQVYDARNPQLRPRIEYERRDVGYFVLRGWPELATMVTGDRLESIPGLWRIAGVATYRSAQGSTYSSLIIERLGDSADILEQVRAAAPQPASPDEPARSDPIRSDP